MNLNRFSRAVVTLCAAICFGTPVNAQPATDPYSIVKMADGVYGFVRADQKSGPEPNLLIVVNDEDVLLVDSRCTVHARAVVGEIRKLTPKPVRYVVNTHWHDDQCRKQRILETFPAVEFIAHTNTRTDITETGLRGGGQPEDHRAVRGDVRVKIRKALDTGKTVWTGKELTDERRQLGSPGFCRSSTASNSPRSRPVHARGAQPSTFEDELMLHRGGRTIELRHLGRGNTRGDVVVWLPKERILATGDLVVSPIPFGIQWSYADWIETLSKLQKTDAQTLFLGHGHAQQDWQHVGTLQNLLTNLVARVTAEIKKGSTLEEIKKTVTLADWKNKLAGDNADLGRAFDAYFVQPAVERTYHQVKGNPEGFS